MQEKAKVIGIEKDIVMVVPLDIDLCIGCANSECKTSGSIFTAVNSQNLDIKVGSEVRIGASVKKQLWQALQSVGIPVLLAVIIWKMVPLVFSGAGEGAQVAGSLIALLAGAAAMYWHSRLPAKDLPEITAVL